MDMLRACTIAEDPLFSLLFLGVPDATGSVNWPLGTVSPSLAGFTVEFQCVIYDTVGLIVPAKSGVSTLTIL